MSNQNQTENEPSNTYEDTDETLSNYTVLLGVADPNDKPEQVVTLEHVNEALKLAQRELAEKTLRQIWLDEERPTGTIDIELDCE